MSTFNTIDDVWVYLNRIPMFQHAGAAAANFSFEHILEVLHEIGNPQNNFPAIHVAGTNGKGTTCYLLETIYENSGHKTGLFTSPHLLRYNERIRVGGIEIPDRELIRFFNDFEKLLDAISLSYFEISTVIAFWYFSERQVDLGIIETGLGGRLDSTNVIDPVLSVITSIALDHQNILGETIEEIAGEKAGIIKKHVPVVLGNLPASALQICEKHAEKIQAPVYHAVSVDPVWNNGVVTLEKPDIKLHTAFKERINIWNIAMAYMATRILNDRFRVEETQFIQAVEKFGGAPGRFEKLHADYEWYFSGSHNLEALESSLEAVQGMKPLKDTVVVFSAMKDKISSEILSNYDAFGRKFFVEQAGERAAKHGDISSQMEVEWMDENNAGNILNELKSELVIFAGSFYFYTIIKRWIKNVS